MFLSGCCTNLIPLWWRCVHVSEAGREDRIHGETRRVVHQGMHIKLVRLRPERLRESGHSSQGTGTRICSSSMWHPIWERSNGDWRLNDRIYPSVFICSLHPLQNPWRRHSSGGYVSASLYHRPTWPSPASLPSHPFILLPPPLISACHPRPATF